MHCKPGIKKSLHSRNSSCSIPLKRSSGIHVVYREKLTKVSDDIAKGRLQYFFHSPESKYPIRDINNKQRKGYKTEPHIEKCAENYSCECLQANIRGFLNDPTEKYLFLFTICRNKTDKNLEDFYNEAFIVGYIKKERKLTMSDGRRNQWFAVQGITKIVSFEDAFALGKRNPRHFKWKKNETETKKILAYLKGGHNVLNQCLKEIKKLEKKEKYKTPVDVCKC